MKIADITALIIALSGIIGSLVAWQLGKRGQKNDEDQQAAANRLQKRIAAFDELESLNDRLTTENARLRDENKELRELEHEAETRGDIRLAAQARRCRQRIDETVAALVTLQAVVVSEVARSSAQHDIDLAAQHVVDEHPDVEA